MDDKLSQRLKSIQSFFIKYKFWFVLLLAVGIILFGMYVRTLNWPILQYKYLSDPDAHVVLRYAETVVNTGSLPAVDYMRYYPVGFPEPGKEFGFMAYFLAYLFKIAHAFDSSVTIAFTTLAYPALTFGFAMLFFFLFINKIFKWKIALLSSAFLIVLPQFLFRTMSGVSDKEALAIWFIFMSLYFFVMSWSGKKTYQIILFGILAGVSTGVTGLITGLVNFLFFIFAAYALIILFFDRFERKDFLNYTSWFLTTMFILLVTGRYDIITLMSSFTSGITIMAFVMFVFDYFFFKTDYIKLKFKERIEHRMPLGLASIIFTFIITIIVTSIAFGPLFIPNKVSSLVYDSISPGKDRWALTVAESHQPYFTDWFGSFGGQFGIFLILIGSCLMFYFLFREAKVRTKIKFLAMYVLFLFGLLYTRYASSGIFNGVSGISKFVYIGSIIAFVVVLAGIYIRSYYNNKEEYTRLSHVHRGLLLVLVFFVVTAIGGRTAIRLLFVFSPVAAIMFAYVFVKGAEVINEKVKSIILKSCVWVLVLLVAFSFLSNFTRSTTLQATYTGPIYDMQWQNAGDWVKKNTAEGSVFIHWWDYGYLVQTGFNRPTVTDGGNAAGSWNFFVGRHILTGQNQKEALDFMYPHNVSYILMVSDEIGKYPAYSSIGSDENYDRYSYIPTFTLDSANIQETRNQSIYPYAGGFALDEDFVYQGKLYPRGQAGVGAVLVPFTTVGNNTVVGQPTAIMVYNNQRVDVPLQCVFLFGREITFSKEGFKGCLRIIPNIDASGNINQVGSALYLSERVRNTLFTKLYLYGQDTENIKTAYSDENSGAPLAVYNGRLIGPLKIWKVTYPSDQEFYPEYLSQAYPNPNVTKVSRSY